MVNNSKRSPPSKEKPSDQERKIQDGPCHSLDEVKALIRTSGYKAIRVATEKATQELSNYCMDEQDLAELIPKLKKDDYHDSEWCKFSETSPWFEADSYRIKQTEKLPSRRDLSNCKYYIKFAVNKLGSILLFFSVHRDVL
ncbi:type II toxin-antitoxin system MqsR family toxin [Ectopseudomonas hydrolytica]|uniref:type II toxin-antitoxin system MqsR family toxin n=1 Tax=Ectopseudomonas hydrolytica TaxID=2493633 RepID=UPI00376F2856